MDLLQQNIYELSGKARKFEQLAKIVESIVI